MNKLFKCSILACTLFLSACSEPAPSSSALNSSDSSSFVSPEEDQNYVDVFIFMGQSNMAGRGDATEAVKVGEGHAYEFRSITDPTKLYPVAEPFGEKENNPDGINDVTGNDGKKTGGLVSAFCEAYYQNTQVPIVAVSAAQGGTSSQQWQPKDEGGDGKLEDAMDRLDLCLIYLASLDDITVRHINMVWLQGENDANHHYGYDYYVPRVEKIVEKMQTVGVESCFVIQIGNYMASVNETYYQYYQDMHEVQRKWCEDYDNSVLVSTKLAGMPESMMHLNNHYLQPAYNVVGNDAGKNTAFYINTGNTPECSPYVAGEEDHINPILE